MSYTLKFFIGCSIYVCSCSTPSFFGPANSSHPWNPLLAMAVTCTSRQAHHEYHRIFVLAATVYSSVRSPAPYSRLAHFTVWWPTYTKRSSRGEHRTSPYCTSPCRTQHGGFTASTYCHPKKGLLLKWLWLRCSSSVIAADCIIQVLAWLYLCQQKSGCFAQDGRVVFYAFYRTGLYSIIVFCGKLLVVGCIQCSKWYLFVFIHARNIPSAAAADTTIFIYFSLNAVWVLTLQWGLQWRISAAAKWVRN